MGRRIFRRLFTLPIHLILIGVALGYLARAVYPPEKIELAPRKFDQPLVEPVDDSLDLPLI